MYELWKVDDFGQRSIVNKGVSCQQLVGKAMQLVTQQNLNSAINVQAAVNDYEQCVVLFFDENDKQIKSIYYAGPTGPQGAHRYFCIGQDGSTQTGKISQLSGVKIKFYIGSMNAKKPSQKKYYASKFDVSKGANGKKQLAKQKMAISSLDQMKDKTIYFIAKR